MTEETEGSQISVRRRVKAEAWAAVRVYVCAEVQSQGGEVYCFRTLVLL